MTRIYLTGRVCVESPGRVVGSRDLGGAQSAALLAFLAVERRRAAGADEICRHLWPDGRPRAWDQALRSLVSKLRRHLPAAEGDPVRHALGCYQLRLPAESWVDVEHARTAIHEAEHLMSIGEVENACGEALVAACIVRDPVLPGWRSEWTDALRDEMNAVRTRALECLAEVWLVKGDPRLAGRDAAEAIRTEPFREPAYRQLMRAQAAAGSRSEVLRTFRDFSRLLADELSTTPAPETVALARALTQPR